MAQADKLGNELLIVIDLAVEDHAHAAVFIVEWLLPSREIDDRQAAVPEAQASFQMQPTFIRTTVELRLVHARQYDAADLAPAPGVEDAGDAAHDLNSLVRKFLDNVRGRPAQTADLRSLTPIAAVASGRSSVSYTIS